jgi:hypothetical protein
MRTLIIATLVLAFALAGCHAPDDGNGAPGDGDGGQNDGGDGGNGGGGAQLAVRVVDPPATATVGESLTWRWEVTGPDGAAIPHTAIHYGNESVPSNPTPASYAEGTNAPGYYTGTAPQQFTHEVTFEEAGTIYYRAHAVVGGENAWTDELTISVTDA